MTITVNQSIQAWERGYDARMANRPFTDGQRETPRVMDDWRAGWRDADDTLRNDEEGNLGSVTLDSYTVQDETGAIVKP